LTGTSKYKKSHVEKNSGQQAVKCNGYGSRFRLAISRSQKKWSKKVIYPRVAIL